jgi:rhodanese-related sulfurtransferase
LLDVRPEDEYGLGHLPGALSNRCASWSSGSTSYRASKRSWPMAEVRTAFCLFDAVAAAALRAHGFNVRRFESGFPEWKAAGLPIEAAA